MKLQVGKIYVRRDGKITAPLVQSEFWDEAHSRSYFADGSYFEGTESQNDLVSELSEKLPSGQMQASATGSLRDNKGKLPLHWIPLCLIEAFVSVLWKNSQPGGGKYPAHNWQKGNKHSVPMDSLLRHAMKRNDGEMVDPDDGLLHSWKMFVNAGFLVFYEKFFPEMNDLQKVPRGGEEK